MTGASVLGALSTFRILLLSGVVNVNPDELSDADRQALQNGRVLSNVWNSLARERDHINELETGVQ